MARAARTPEHPALVRGLLSGLTLRLAELTRRLAELTGARVEARFARLFLKLAHQIGRADRGGTFVPMPLSRQELADLTGATIETAIRIMSRWQKEDVLHTDKDGFVLLDRATLEDVAASWRLPTAHSALPGTARGIIAMTPGTSCRYVTAVMRRRRPHLAPNATTLSR